MTNGHFEVLEQRAAPEDGVAHGHTLLEDHWRGARTRRRWQRRHQNPRLRERRMRAGIGQSKRQLMCMMPVALVAGGRPCAVAKAREGICRTFNFVEIACESGMASRPS